MAESPSGARTESPRGRRLSPTTFAAAAGATGGFTFSSVGSVVRRGFGAHPPVPPLARLTPGVLASVFGEELVLRAASGINEREIEPETLSRRSREADVARDLFDASGYLDNPASYHRAPPAPTAFALEDRQVGTLRFQSLSFDSDYAPLPGLPGGERWTSQIANRRCYASVLEHPGGPRPWLIVLHPFGMGRPMDLLFAGAGKYHRDLGYNVLMPVLPLHGPRHPGRPSGEGLLSLDWISNLHALTQTVWDVRRCMAWIRTRDAMSISLHGMSLGGYTAALVGGLEPVDCAVIGVTSSTLHGPLAAACTRSPLIRHAMQSHDLLGERIDALNSVVTPTALPCQVPHDRRFMYAGLADRVSLPKDVQRLWEHWEQPTIMWSPTSHVTTLTSSKVRRFVRSAVEMCAWDPIADPSPETRSSARRRRRAS